MPFPLQVHVQHPRVPMKQLPHADAYPRHGAVRSTSAHGPAMLCRRQSSTHTFVVQTQQGWLVWLDTRTPTAPEPADGANKTDAHTLKLSSSESLTREEQDPGGTGEGPANDLDALA